MICFLNIGEILPSEYKINTESKMDDNTNNTNANAPKDESNVTLTIRLIMQGKVGFIFFFLFLDFLL